jgi:hypothetical protein
MGKIVLRPARTGVSGYLASRYLRTRLAVPSWVQRARVARWQPGWDGVEADPRQLAADEQVAWRVLPNIESAFSV